MVAVLDKCKKPLDPCSEKRAKKLLNSGRARIHKYYPVFTIRLVDRYVNECVVHPLVIGIDPGSKHTGIAVANISQAKAMCLIQLDHKQHIHRDMLKRSMYRMSRRQRKLRCRPKRFLNRTSKHRSKYTPSIKHIYESIINIIIKLKKYFNIKYIKVEIAKFDTQKMQVATISGKEYQQGELFQKEVKEYILAKYHHRCVYCGKTNVPLEIDHVIPRSRGGTNRISNLVLSCRECNQKKSNKSLEEFCPDKASSIKKQLKSPLKDASKMNIIMPKLLSELKKFKLPVSTTYGYLTKKNRQCANAPKTHALDALYIAGFFFTDWDKLPTILITCMGRGKHCRTNVDKYGFPKSYLSRNKIHYGFMTGDIVKANVPFGKKYGIYIGRVQVRKKGSFNIQGIVTDLSYKYFTILQHNDGYNYGRVTYE